MEWLVSEEDAPQALLPLPKSWPVDPDGPEGPSTPLRGTRDWAPPRPQIVLTLLPTLSYVSSQFIKNSFEHNDNNF